MSEIRAISLSGQSTMRRIADLGVLVKLKLTLLVVFTSVMAYVVGMGGIEMSTNIWLLALGGFLVTGAANALNQVLEKDFDLLMERTSNRPVAAGRMSPSQAIVWAGLMLLVGTVVLTLINPLTGLLGMISVVLYAFVYTPLKRFTTWAVPLGAIPGAMPTLIGCVAAEGELTILALILFAIQFIWQFPHFWAIAFLSYEDYKSAGYRFLPETNGKLDARLGLYSFLYTVILVVMIMPMHLAGLTNNLGLILLFIVSAHYGMTAFHFFKEMERKTALKLMFSSFIYLPVALLALVISI